ncbi:MAG: hypothetical protein HC836_10665 [Richelia sp. RM2_1_2]|nr:hypothetical protein [Richelia sp. RM2_1_2]
MMMNTSIEIATREFPLASSFPGYRKRKVRVVKTCHVSIQDLNWSGGTRSEYHAVTIIAGGNWRVVSLQSWNTSAPWNNLNEGSTVDLIPGCAMVRTGHFCGKESMLTLYIHPADASFFGF